MIDNEEQKDFEDKLSRDANNFIIGLFVGIALTNLIIYLCL